MASSIRKSIGIQYGRGTGTRHDFIIFSIRGICFSFFTSLQVGVLDVNKVTNVPIIMKPFTSEEVYKITWGLITDESNATPHWALFASSKTKLVYFPDKDKGNRMRATYATLDYFNQNSFLIPVVKYLCEDKQISTVSAGKKWLSVGSQDGWVYILKLNGLEVRYT